MDEYKYSEFGNRLKSLRESKNIKQGKFAERVGIARQSIGNYESGKQYPTIEILIKMADCLDCSLDYLLGRTDETGTTISKPEDECLSELRHFLGMLAEDEAEYLTDAIGKTLYTLAQSKENPQRRSFIAYIAEIHYTLAEYVELSTKYNKRFSRLSGKDELDTEKVVSALIRFNDLDEMHETVEDIKKSCLLAAVPSLVDVKKLSKRKKSRAIPNSKTKEFAEKFKEMLEKED
jgi:Predicted transcriptional regulators